MAIHDDDVRRVKEATDIVAVLSEAGVGLKRSGARWMGLCPFHAEKTPSFSVNAQLGVYNCFGCSAHGDAIAFLREREGLTFVEAVERLAAKVGIVLQTEDPKAARSRERRAALLAAMEKAVDWYHERLLRSPDAGRARDYLRSRGYDGEVVRRFRLGWAPDAWDTLVKALRLPDDVMSEAGLAHISEGRRTDAFRARVLFPIFDHTGAAVAIGGRQLPEGRPPKYKNSTETPLYRKSEVLYGLSWAKDKIIREGTAVLCEGYTDVIAFHRSGITSAVATCGTAATEDHVRRLKQFGATRLVLGYDADGAGQGAAERFYAWERSHGLDLRVVALPAGTDPADVAARDPSALQKAVDEALPFLAFRLQRLWGASDLRTNEGRSRAAEAAVVFVAEHPDPLVRDQYVMEIADRTQSSPDRLRAAIAEVGRGGRRAASAVLRPRRDGPRVAIPPAEEAALWFAVNEPEAVAALLEEELFEHEVAVGAMRVLASAATFDEAVATADEDVAALLSRLANSDGVGSDALDVLASLVGRRAREAQGRLGRSSPDLSTEDFVRRGGDIRLLQEELQRLDDPEARPDAVARLVAWLVGHRREG
jgi:DNA primase